MSLLSSITGASSKSSVNKKNKWEDELDSIYQQIQSRDKFKYDMNNDALYKQYAQQYQQNAKLAMQDTVGQVSALTGGYGNSYAQTAGQAVYNQTMGGMNDKALELYQLALNRYNAEGDRLMNLYGITADQYQTEYNRIRDEVADEQWQKSFDESQRQYNLGLAMDAAGMAIDVGKFGASMAFDMSRAAASDAQWEKSFGYQKERDAVSDAQWQQSFDYQKQRDGISDSQFAQDLAYKYAALNSKDNKPVYKAENIDEEKLSKLYRKYAMFRGDEGRASAILDDEEAGTINEDEVKFLFERYGMPYPEG